ncbi:hypothetical protein GMB70_05425 [Turicibacter sanguinis]|nr:hypothetical protein [Turicibacter sanguinis]
MKEKLKEKKVQVGVTIVTVVVGVISGLAFRKIKDKQREQRLLEELENSIFENFDI